MTVFEGVSLPKPRRLRKQAFWIGLLSLALTFPEPHCHGSDAKTFMLAPQDVQTNSIILAPHQTTNVMFFFRFANKPREEIQNIVAGVQGDEVVIEGCGRTRGIISGILTTNTVPVGLAVTFETMDKARQARACLTRPPANAGRK